MFLGRVYSHLSAFLPDKYQKSNGLFSRLVTNSVQSLRLSTDTAQRNNSEVLEERFSGEYIVLTRTRKQREKKNLKDFQNEGLNSEKVSG